MRGLHHDATALGVSWCLARWFVKSLSANALRRESRMKTSALSVFKMPMRERRGRLWPLAIMRVPTNKRRLPLAISSRHLAKSPPPNESLSNRVTLVLGNSRLSACSILSVPAPTGAVKPPQLGNEVARRYRCCTSGTLICLSVCAMSGGCCSWDTLTLDDIFGKREPENSPVG